MTASLGINFGELQMPQLPSEEIKSRLDIVEVIREYVSLKPAGVNFRTNCPFHHEKSPSFIVSPDKQIWHCFGCGKGGDVFKFVMEMEGLSFTETLRQLAPKAGVELKRFEADSQMSTKRNRLMDVMKLASQYYHKVLTDSPAGGKAREYLARRGFSVETIKRWQLGYSPDTWDSLLNFLKSRGYTDEEILLAGLSVKHESKGSFYDRFRGRIMFPINDVSGNVVAFTARVSPEKEATEVMGKYINSPQTPIYDKSRILFGLDKAKSEIKSQDLAILVEGQADAVTAHQHGFTNIVATSGTALTAEQVKLLKRFTNNLALSFDMDKAGENAVERGAREALAAEMNVKVISLPSGKDPDECIKNNPEEWRTAVSGAKPVMQYHFDKVFAKLNPNEVEDKRQAVRLLLPTIALLANKIEQDSWLKKLGQIINITENIMREMLASSLKNLNAPIPRRETQTQPTAQPIRTAAKPSREELISQMLLALVLKFPEHFEYLSSQLSHEQLVGKHNATLYRNLVIYYNRATDNWSVSVNQEMGYDEYGRPILANSNQIEYKEFRSWLNQQDTEPVLGFSADEPKESAQVMLLDQLSLLAEKDYFEIGSAEAKNEIIKAISSLKQHNLSTRLKEIEREIEQSEKRGEKERMKSLLEEFKILTEELKEQG